MNEQVVIAKLSHQSLQLHSVQSACVAPLLLLLLSRRRRALRPNQPDSAQGLYRPPLAARMQSSSHTKAHLCKDVVGFFNLQTLLCVVCGLLSGLRLTSCVELYNRKWHCCCYARTHTAVLLFSVHCGRGGEAQLVIVTMGTTLSHSCTLKEKRFFFAEHIRT